MKPVIKNHYMGLDLFRIISCITVCAFHTAIHLGCNYGVLQEVVTMGAVFMTAFFMLSGFLLFLNHTEEDFHSLKNMKIFWVKRAIGILPMYYMTAALFILVARPQLWVKELLLAPIEVLGLQSTFSSLFNVSHNGGTWFISCIVICYFAYPFLQETIKQMQAKAKITLIGLCSFLLLYSPFIVATFQTYNIYSNPFFRLLEFTIGILLASLWLDIKDNRFVKKYLFNWWTIAIENLLYIVGVTLAVKINIGVNNYMLYSWIGLPLFGAMLFSLSGVESRRLSNSKCLKFAGSLTYAFFLSQLYSNSISKKIIAYYGISNNFIKIFLGWSCCIIIALVLRYVERKITTKLRGKLLCSM
ncbi:acyltransferase family protein [Pygmaiobacter massiliensis]|uniref:acyltransferase family protein n=1 Tax=Pygmaiobacter massiliensis TaxID=1917873 RepID=UPI0028A109B4|nr:acyltransferase [Pygmaiobacter massiliensis]